MAKPTNTIGDRDYGRRTYASKKKYEEQRKLATNAHIDRVRRLEKHSEFKKPYLPDQSYPEMEGFNFDPYDPKWPGLPPGEPPTTGPVDPGGPVVVKPIVVKPTPDREMPPFLGCQFWPGIFNPDPIAPGKYSIGEIWIGSQDSIVSIECKGPGTCSFALAECNQKNYSKFSGWKGMLSGPGVCQIVVWADKNPDPRKGTAIVISVTMASGMKCATTVDVEPCPAEIPLEWDSEESPWTIARNSNVSIAVKGGSPPFNWSVSGTDFYLGAAKTYGYGNTLSTGNLACGLATITVTDSCDETVTGAVECTTGQWVETTPECNCPGIWTRTEFMGGYTRYWREVPGCKIWMMPQTSYGGAADCGVCENTWCTPVNEGDPVWGCRLGECIYGITAHYWSGRIIRTQKCYSETSSPDWNLCASVRGFYSGRWDC